MEIKAEDRAKELQKQGKTGVQIAKAMQQEGYTLDQTHIALYNLRYTVDVQYLYAGVPELHVSDSPMEIGLGVMISTEGIKALPSIVWKKTT